MQEQTSRAWHRIALAIAACVIAAAFMIGCGGDKASEGDGAKNTTGNGEARLRVVATTGQVGDLVRNIGGSRVELSVLMGPGIDPHLYKASAGDVERLRRADLIFYNGLHLEAKMGEVLSRLGSRTPTYAVAEAIPEESLIAPPEFAGSHDPHVWLDVALWQIAATVVRDALIEQDAAHATGYQERAATYLSELVALDDYVRERAAGIPPARRVMITAHDAFNYFGRAYAIEVRGLQGISTVTEAGTADMRDLATFIAERRIPAMFVESSVPPKSIEAVQAAVRARGFAVAIGGELYSDAMGEAGTPAGTYTGMVRHNIDTIAKALSVD